MHGWVPITVQVIAAIVLVAAIGWRNRRWRLRVAAVGRAGRGRRWRRRRTGTSPRRGWPTTPPRMRCGSGSGCPASPPAVLVAGWRGARWWRRGVSVLALPLCLLCAGAGAEPVGRLLPHRADRVEPADRGTAARPDRPGHRDRDAAGSATIPAEGHRGAGQHQRRGVGFQAPRRAGLPSAGLVRHQSRRRSCRR